MFKRIVFSVAVSGALLLAAGGNIAFAGEVTGNGRSLKIDSPTLLHARSFCAYSGLEDEPIQPGLVQSYGQIVKEGGKAFATSPSVGCNPTADFEE